MRACMTQCKRQRQSSSGGRKARAQNRCERRSSTLWANEHRYYSCEWMMLQMKRYLWVLQPELEATLPAVRAEIGMPPLPEPYISVQVRHGDKQEGAPVHPLSHYALAVRQIGDALGIYNVYFSSDDERVYGWLPGHDFFKDTKFKFFYMPFEWFLEYDMNQQGVINDLQAAEFGAEHKGWAAQKEMSEGARLVQNFQLLADSAYFIGTLHSNMGKTVWELMSYHTFPPHFYDLDNVFYFGSRNIQFTPHLGCGKDRMDYMITMERKVEAKRKAGANFYLHPWDEPEKLSADQVNYRLPRLRTEFDGCKKGHHRKNKNKAKDNGGGDENENAKK